MRRSPRQLTLDISLYVSIGAVLVSLFYWSMSNNWVNEESIDRWGATGLSTLGLLAVFEPWRAPARRIPAFWLVVSLVLVLRVLFHAWLVWSITRGSRIPAYASIPVEFLLLRMLVARLFPQASRNYP